MAAAPFACILDATPRAMKLICSHYTLSAGVLSRV